MLMLKDVTRVYRLSKYNSVAAVVGATLTIRSGEFVVITGRSGSGKTTLLNLMAGLIRPTAGKVLLEGTPIWSLSDKEQSLLRSRKIGFIFQFPSLLPSLSVLENVTLPTVFTGAHHGKEIVKRARELLQRVGLADKLKAYPRQLSAGQQQRVVIARSLINSPRLLLADEPTSNLDERTELEIMELFGQIHADLGITVVMVTHASQLVAHGTRVLEMSAGKITSGIESVENIRS